VLKALEEARQAKRIRGSLEARVSLRATDSLAPVLEQYRDLLRYLFIVSDVQLGGAARPDLRSTEIPGLEIAVEPAAGKKCERCWNYSPRVGSFPDYPGVCERCYPVLETWAG
jgi:isoleucyl-tRNA synthetase